MCLNPQPPTANHKSIKCRQSNCLLGSSILLTALASLNSASAQRIISEGFNYTIPSTAPDPNGGLNGGNGLPATNVGANPAGIGIGFRGAYATGLSAVAGLSYSQGGKVLQVSGRAGKPAPIWGNDVIPHRCMATNPFLSQRVGGVNNGVFGVENTSLSFSVLVNTSSAESRAFAFKLGSLSNYNLFIENTADTWTISPNASGAIGGSGPMVVGETALLVGRIDFVTGTRDVFSFWVNPSLDDPLGAPNISHVSSIVDYNGIANLNTKPTTAAAVANAMTMDEFRLVTTAASVMPTVGVAAPAAPSALVATSIVDSEANLTWTDNASNETQFVIERSLNGTTGWKIVGTPNPGTVSFTNTGLSSLTTYYCRIRAQNGGGASAVSVTAAEERFRVERSPDGTTGWTSVAELGMDITSFQNVGLTDATSYYYRVTALAEANNSAPSAVASATTLALPAPIPLDPICLAFVDPDATVLGSVAPVTGFTSYSSPGSVFTTSALSYLGLAASLGNGLLLSANSRGSSFSIDTTLPGLANYVSGGQIGGSGLGVLYVRWLARDIEGSQANVDEFENSLTAFGGVSTYFGVSFIRAMFNSTGVNNGFNIYNNSAIAPSAQTTLYVARFTSSPTGDTVMNVFVNQLTEVNPDSSATGKINFDRIKLASFGTAPEPSVDEFRTATSWAGAVDASGVTSYGAWAATPFANPFTSQGASVDFDNDGLTNLSKFVVGGDPTRNDSPPISPSVITTGTNLVVTLKRSDASELQPTSVIVQVSSDLNTWNPADEIVIGATSNPDPIGPSGASYTVDDTGSLDTVVFTIPKGAAPVKFARVRAEQ